MTDQKIYITKSYDLQDVWEALGGSDFSGCRDFVDKINDYDYKNPKPFTIIHTDKEGVNYKVTTVLTPEVISEAFTKAVLNKETHCGSYDIDDLDNADACFAYTILQYALFGEVVFG